jgi:AraC family transcriptional regulator of adaptative response/methylated-DNA-[protein]-cysteine methyltransferase
MADLVRRTVAAVNAPEKPHDLPLDVRGTAFQLRVWQELQRIPRGETRSYGEVAAAVGVPGGARAVGAACGSNPVSIVVPCHRVVTANGGLGGYAWGLEAKSVLLEREGARGREGSVDLADDAGLDLVHEATDAVAVQQQG